MSHMPATSTVLTGLSLATSIAREATDGVPIVKQVLGVASRIVGLAEQIDKNREEFHGLADRAKQMDATISAIVADREPDPQILRRLEGLNGVLNSIEARFSAHIKQGQLRKLFRYIFAVRKDVDRLKGEFDNRLRELEVTANLDTNFIARGNSRFVGQYRNIRHCEIHLLRCLTPSTGNGCGNGINCHLATCEGSSKVFVVRNMMSTGHHRILEQMSLIQNRHPGIARLYGWNVGPSSNRFTVLETGNIRPLEQALSEGSAELSVLGKMVAKLVVCRPDPCTRNEIELDQDVSCHLHKQGAAWKPTRFSGAEVYVDSNYEPTIGIDDDLATMESTPEYYAGIVSWAIGKLLDKSTTSFRSHENQFPTSHLRSTMWCIEMFGDLIDTRYGTSSRENIVRMADIPSLIPLSEESWSYLHHADRSGGSAFPQWGFVLRNLVSGSRKCDGSIMGAWYGAHQSGEGDVVTVHCVEGDVDVFYYREIHVEIPDSAADKVRQRLGIPSKGETEWQNFWMQRFADVGATSTECTGWTEGAPTWELW